MKDPSPRTAVYVRGNAEGIPVKYVPCYVVYAQLGNY